MVAEGAPATKARLDENGSEKGEDAGQQSNRARNLGYGVVRNKPASVARWEFLDSPQPECDVVLKLSEQLSILRGAGVCVFMSSLNFHRAGFAL